MRISQSRAMRATKPIDCAENESCSNGAELTSFDVRTCEGEGRDV